MKYRFISAPLRVVLGNACLAVSLACAVHPAIAAPEDQAAAQTISFEIAAGPLTTALSAFAATAGISLSFEPTLAIDKTSAGLNGSHRVDDGLALLLAGTGLGAVAKTDGGYTLRALPPASDATLLPVVKVAAAVDDTITEGSGSYTARAVVVGGKTARDPRQIQQSISVVTAQRIRDQNITTAEEALAQATGISMTQSSGYLGHASFSARGFSMVLQTDGGAPQVNNFWYNSGLPDIAMLDHIEVLRGSDGLFAGAGNPGGTVNLVRKKPLDHNQVLFDALAGGWDRYRTQIDVTGPLGFGGKLRGRAVLAREDRDYFYDTVSSEKSVAYGVLEYDLTSSTLVTFGGSHEQTDRSGLYFGLPRYSTGADLKLPRSSCLCTDWSGRNDLNRDLFLQLRQSIGSNWNLRVNLTKQWVDYDYVQGNATGAVDPATLSGPLLAGARTDVSNGSKLADVTLDGRFDVFGFEQELVVGGNWQDMFSNGTGVSLYPPTARPAVNVFDFNSGGFAQPGVPAAYVPLLPFGGQKQSGFYTTLRSEITPSLHSTLGIRFSNFEYLYPPGGVFYRESGVPIPFAGLSFDATRDVSLYASYSRIYQSQAGSLTEDGEPLKPIEGNTLEAGAKGAWIDGALTASVAVYKTLRKNASVQVSTSTLPNCCFIADAEAESRGVDAEVTGEILPGWQLSLGYTFNLNEYKSGYGARNGTSYTPRTPKHLLKLWTMAQLPGGWSAARVGGGVNWQSDNFVTGTAATFNTATDRYDGPTVPFSFTQKAYAVVALRGDYRLNDHWSAGLNLNNLFDATYYQTISTSNGSNFYGEPRNVTLSVNGRW
ncbi:TonB-dependent siderophore receptor [Nevskia sp.]|uniref:TonB-dependent siderophore receptor n=1 Tax=Nevskia sp. TaxID=1929292 RepID=UPI0025DC4C2B|nr:TonB-dependent siderophore receptor [Nevskia sp.]